jgi:hypothetical protein
MFIAPETGRLGYEMTLVPGCIIAITFTFHWSPGPRVRIAIHDCAYAPTTYSYPIPEFNRLLFGITAVY